jgi:hypothetical protein
MTADSRVPQQRLVKECAVKGAGLQAGDFGDYFFGISLHRTSRFRPLHGWFTPLRGLAMLLQGSISLFMGLHGECVDHR